MAERRKSAVSHETAAEQGIRDQEVLRANRELAAYFKGRRTERAARAALKIIKAFVRDRERRDAGSCPPLPGAGVAKTPKEVANRKAARDGGEPHRRKPRRKPRGTLSTGVTAIEPRVNADSPRSSVSD